MCHLSLGKNSNIRFWFSSKPWGSLLTCICVMGLSACEPATPESVVRAANSKAPELDATSKIAEISTPRGCTKLSASDRVEPYSIGFQRGYVKGSSSTCGVTLADGLVLVYVNQYTVPFRLAFNLGTALDRDLYAKVIPVDPRRFLVPELKQAERKSLGSIAGATFTNHEYSVLPNDGGVYGADACLRFSFDSDTPTVKSKYGSNWKSRGLRCGRVRRDTLDVEYVLLDINVNFVKGSTVPAQYSQIAAQTEASLRFR